MPVELRSHPDFRACLDAGQALCSVVPTPAGAATAVQITHRGERYQATLQGDALRLRPLRAPRMLNARRVSSFNDLNTNNTRISVRKTCILYIVFTDPRI